MLNILHKHLNNYKCIKIIYYLKIILKKKKPIVLKHKQDAIVNDNPNRGVFVSTTVDLGPFSPCPFKPLM